MKRLDPILSDLRERRLWPVAVALVIALVAVAVLLPKSAKPASVGQGAPVAGPVASGSIPAVSVQSGPSNSELTGHARDPFTQPGSSTSTTPGTSSTGTGTTSTTPTSSGTSGTSGTTGTSTTSTPTTTGTTPTPLTPKPPGARPTRAPAGLTATQSYHVTLSITNSAGGVDQIDPLERLSILPSSQTPLLVELGVLKGGQRVLFAVQPGTVISGPGGCTPGPVDCEILSLGQDQIEQLSMQSASGVVSVAQFAVTGITADQYSSAAAAGAARRTESAAGGKLLRGSTLGALSLFQYDPSIGAVVDLRDLTIGGN